MVPAMTLFRLLPLLLLLALAACGGQRLAGAGGQGGSYLPPGPESDPWGPYIREAATRFDVPDTWIREVMRQESGGHAMLNGRPTTSYAGAMGLMQLMPATWGMLRERYSLGDDPYDPHDNIIAGTGYIRELYDRYGSPAFLAAYNAGPQRLEDYNNGIGSLPNQTVDYLASVAPRLGNARPMSGPLAVYADAQPVRRLRNGCDPDAAYDPDRPCHAPPEPAPVQVAEAPVVAEPLAPAPARTGSAVWGGQPTPVMPPQQPRPAPTRFAFIPAAAAETVRPSPADTRWSIQVGAFASPEQARMVADAARGLAPVQLRGAATVLGTTSPFGGRVLYRARLAGLSAYGAQAACARLSAEGHACLTVPPGG
jgi:D-alanyl-D-alanine carboxypeptidase